MTQEAYKIARAFKAGKICSTRRTDTTGEEVHLFGNRIAWRDKDTGVVWMTLAGWPTVTTRDRLNAICSVYGVPQRFSQMNFEQYYGGVPVESNKPVPLVGPLGMQALLVTLGG